MEVQGISLRKRISILLVAMVVACTMLAAPAQAANNNLGHKCENRHDREKAQLKCCHKRANSNAQENNCKQYVRNH
jgi:hypothetical protein